MTFLVLVTVAFACAQPRESAFEAVDSGTTMGVDGGGRDGAAGAPSSSPTGDAAAAPPKDFLPDQRAPSAPDAATSSAPADVPPSTDVAPPAADAQPVVDLALPPVTGCAPARCAAPEHATAECREDRCAWSCNAGFTTCEAGCLPTAQQACCGADRALDSDRDGTADCTVNLVRNGQFRSDVASWTPLDDSMVEWSAMDAAGSGNSGSLKATNSTPKRPFFVAGGGDSSCFLATASATHRLSIQYFIPPGQEATASATLQILWSESADCSPGDFPTSYFDLGKDVGAWRSFTASLTTPPGTKSGAVRISPYKGEAAPFVVYFDNLVLARR